MLCECGEREATVHEVIIRQGKPIERHLCEQCAAKLGIAPKPEANLAQLMSQYVLPQVAAKAHAAREAASLVCSSCGLSYEDFKRTGLLGCAECYRVFQDQLGPLLERAHEGATHHVGKVPKRALAASRGEGSRVSMEALFGSIQERAERITTLRRQLDEAIRAEQYELAARVRDELTTLTMTSPQTTPETSPQTTTQSPTSTGEPGPDEPSQGDTPDQPQPAP